MLCTLCLTRTGSLPVSVRPPSDTPAGTFLLLHFWVSKSVSERSMSVCEGQRLRDKKTDRPRGAQPLLVVNADRLRATSNQSRENGARFSGGLRST